MFHARTRTSEPGQHLFSRRTVPSPKRRRTTEMGSEANLKVRIKGSGRCISHKTGGRFHIHLFDMNVPGMQSVMTARGEELDPYSLTCSMCGVRTLFFPLPLEICRWAQSKPLSNPFIGGTRKTVARRIRVSPKHHVPFFLFIWVSSSLPRMARPGDTTSGTRKES